MVLYEFYGDGCPHCEKMDPVVVELEDEEGIEVKQLEVWNDEENAEKMNQLDDGKCGGVPFFYSTESDQWICGETDIDELKRWAGGKELA